MDCSTIVVSYNTFDLTREAVESALAATEEIDHEIIVIDNNSPDNSGRRLRKVFDSDKYPTVTILANRDNVGFARANNQGAGLAKGEVLFFLNPDTIVLDRAIAKLWKFVKSVPEAGAVGPKVLNADGSIQTSIASLVTAKSILRYNLPLGNFLSGLDRRDDQMPPSTSRADIIKGCALAIRRDVFDHIGGWDESYFMYSEEIELCYSLIRAGYTNYYVPDAEIIHLGGASTRETYVKQQLVQQLSTLNFIRRHHGTPLLMLYRITGILGYAGRAAYFPFLARLRPENADDYRLRGSAASALWRWFLFDWPRQQ